MQKDFFLNIEWLNWYNRNRDYLVSDAVRNDKIIDYFEKNISSDNSTLEIWCANWWRIGFLKEAVWWDYYWIEPWKEVVEEWKKIFPDINLFQWTADNLPFDNNYFDNIVIWFCLYLCDREDLFKIAYEVDRVLKDWWNIIILDFEPGYIYKNDYVHLEWLNSYKMDYSKLFLWNPSYFLSKKEVYSHKIDWDLNNPNERISLNILKKNLKFSYPNCIFYE